MKIQQFEDKGLAHYAYAVLSECEQQVILIDPARNPQPITTTPNSIMHRSSV